MVESDPGRDAATFCATLVDEWVRAGVEHAVVAPGSRSTPMAVALAADGRLRTHVVLDERSAAFTALGVGRATDRPAIVVTTSGTAAVELHPAVVEAHHDGVAMICVTADRPPELQGVGAPQTVDQVGLYGGAVRWAASPGPPEPVTAPSASSWRSLAARAVLEAVGGRRPPGPVHLNLGFREPLVGEPAPLPPGRDGSAPWHGRPIVATTLGESALAAAAHALFAGDDRSAGARCGPHATRGVIIAGSHFGAGGAAAVHELAAALGWPVLADPRSGARAPHPTTVAHFDAILRAKGFASSHTPDVVLRVGRLPASKVLGEWLAGATPREVVLDPTGAWIDAARAAAHYVVADPVDTCRRLVEQVTGQARQAVTPGDWLDGWQEAESAAARSIAATLQAEGDGDPAQPTTEPGTARAVAAGLPDGGHMVVSSSMPVRDVEWFAAPRVGWRVHANRGANGIDGVVSTAVGVALASGAPTTALLGDLAFLHDSNALLGLRHRPVDLTVVVVDNHGGGIFSFLPQAAALDSARFEQLFGTPQDVDVAGLAAAHGIPVLATLAEARAASGVRLVVVPTDRARNVDVHDRIHAAVVQAIDG